MRKSKKICAIALSLTLMIISILMTGCSCIGIRLYEDGYYIYSLNRQRPVVMIVGLTDLGREQETLIIPKYIDNYEVVLIGGRDSFWRQPAFKPDL